MVQRYADCIEKNSNGIRAKELSTWNWTGYGRFFADVVYLYAADIPGSRLSQTEVDR
jgi:hypothetical protein